MKKDYLLDIMRSKETVFTANGIALLWGKTDVGFVRKKIYRYIKTGKLYPIRKGIYAKAENYNRDELATKIYTPSYISFETALGRAGVTFQYYSQIFVASYLAREIKIEGQTYSFKKIKDSILTNQTGVEIKDNYCIASPERAFLDVIYLRKDYYFDNLGGIDWQKVYEILPIYGGNKRMEKEIKQHQKETEQGLN
ncbi:MAG: hypothetical protein ABIC82_04430 [bacterium]